MKIIQLVLGKANPDRMNGVNKVAYKLALHQHGLGYDVEVWGIANSLEHNYPPRPFATKLFRQMPNKLKLDGELRAAIAQASKNTVFHIHGSFIPEFYHISRLLKKRGLRYVYTPHGALTAAAMQQSKWRKRIYFKLFERTVIRNAHAVQLLGEQEYTFIDTLMKVPQKVLIPNGMDLDEIPSGIEPAKNEYPVFSFCGRIDSYHKGLDYMLRGFARLIKMGHRASLELIGDGADRPVLQALAAELGIENQVTWHGARYGDEKYHLMARGDVFLHTSRMEGFPMAVLEAAALGLPCLTSEPTNINSFIRKYNAGIPLSELGEEPVTLAMEEACRLFNENKLARLGRNARKMVAEAFDWKNICRQLYRLYLQEEPLSAPAESSTSSEATMVPNLG